MSLRIDLGKSLGNDICQISNGKWKMELFIHTPGYQ